MFLQSTSLPYTPARIISLVPSQTELLHYFGLEEETVGITKFCVHPEKWFHAKTRVGGTKTINRDIIDRLKPDLIIANKEENVKLQIEELASEYPVWVTDVNNLGDALQMITDVGILTGKRIQAAELHEKIRSKFEELKSIVREKYLVTYLIWRNPYMTIGGDTFISDMLDRCGFINLFAQKTRYPDVDILQLCNSEVKRTGHCPLLFLSSEPYPFKEKHVHELQEILPGTKILLVDGEMFSWYGSRLLMATEYFKALRTKIVQLVTNT